MYVVVCMPMETASKKFIGNFVKVNYKALDKTFTINRTIRGEVVDEDDQFLFVLDQRAGKVAVQKTEIIEITFITADEARLS